MFNHLLGNDLLDSRTPLLPKYSTSCITGSREAVKVRMSFILPVWEEILSAAWTRKEKAVWFSERLKFKHYLLELLVGISFTLGTGSVMIPNEDLPFSSSSCLKQTKQELQLRAASWTPSVQRSSTLPWQPDLVMLKSTTALMGITFWPDAPFPVVKRHCFKCFSLKWVYDVQRKI